MSKKNKKRLQGLGIGLLFGFLLQKGGVTQYDVIIGQLRLTDFTVIKIILSAIIVTMLGVSYLYPRDKVPVETKSGSIRNALIGGLLFGVGFALLGYCPGTIAGAIGNGALDALIAGFVGIVAGTMIFAMIYAPLQEHGILTEDRFSEVSLFHRFSDNPFKFTVPFAAFLIALMFLLEQAGY